MKINLDNYESFFLLHVDNELSAMQRKELDEFLRSYPYLQAELDQLKETVLPVQESSFNFKDNLLKPVISEKLLQENMLLHLDNELAGDQKYRLEEQLLKDETLQKEWALLKRIKLSANEIVLFPDKRILYRHEAARVITGRFLRMAVAAIFIGAGFFVGVRFFTNQANDNGRLADNNTLRPADTKVNPAQNAEPINPAKSEQNAETGTLAAATPPVAVKKMPAVTETFKQPVTSPMATVRSKQKDVKPITVGNEQQPVTERDHNTIARLTQPVNDIRTAELIAANVKRQPTDFTDTNIQTTENIFAQRTSLGDEDDNNDDHIFMIDEDKVSRTKAAGFIKKLKRTVERTTKIKAGNSLRIAGFEFAVK